MDGDLMDLGLIVIVKSCVDMRNMLIDARLKEVCSDIVDFALSRNDLQLSVLDDSYGVKFEYLDNGKISSFKIEEDIDGDDEYFDLSSIEV